jgi:hypothetical protein
VKFEALGEHKPIGIATLRHPAVQADAHAALLAELKVASQLSSVLWLAYTQQWNLLGN